MARTLKHLFGAMLLLPALVHAEIVQRQVVTAITAAPGGGDILTVDEDTGCGGRQLRMEEGELAKGDAYAALRATLARRIRDKTPMLVTLARCPVVGATGDAALPLVRKLSACQPGACADGKARLYLDEHLVPQEKRLAPYMLVLPLPPGKLSGAWQVEIVHAVDEQKPRMSAQFDAADFVSGKPVGGYTAYYDDGKIEKQVGLDAQGRKDGLSSSFYPDGLPETRGAWRHGLQEGVHETFHATGKLLEAFTYRDGMQVDGPFEAFDEDGNLVARQTLRNGKLDGEIITFFPDGKVASRAQAGDGMLNGLCTEYYPDGSVRSTVTRVNDKATGDALEYHPNGKLASKLTYGDDGKRRSARSFNEQGVLILEEAWDPQERLQGTIRAWHDDGSVKSECLYVAGKAQGKCGVAQPSPETL
ncbi:toxin-antitoxin system YwqK family antitoxin [Janthinobacterium sp. SUN026]|uniref:toxin-antitoxin system YwqK family antitoxin n=1 Tax=Janthinobacterium sp. SUN026 TaxID=3002438 RepID=UPI0025B263AB|nr:toxin-antitoxin system YwqK family antitoxin [Janthinobacterium sp. SUN026]MDN2672019.1 toxin-antitoxin system YwqK family antitoxin [Janthinobacterium sp. SUN026]